MKLLKNKWFEACKWHVTTPGKFGWVSQMPSIKTSFQVSAIAVLLGSFSLPEHNDMAL